MLLLYHLTGISQYTVYEIYIPLCFYFIPREYENSAESKLIYIPLCFYFILFAVLCIYPGLQHLHSTMLLLYPHTLCRGFRHILYLHSTMLLLYLRHLIARPSTFWFTFHYASTLSESSYAPCGCWRNLHSTMLLLYPKAKPERRAIYRIYIPLCFYFIPKRISVTRNEIYIYIPLCFYFIRSTPGWVRALGSDLHSTMLLLYP